MQIISGAILNFLRIGAIKKLINLNNNLNLFNLKPIVLIADPRASILFKEDKYSILYPNLFMMIFNDF